MRDKIKAQYNSLYASTDHVYGTEPIPPVARLGELVHGGKVLDVGGGEGRNALYLAEQGFVVSVVDISEVGINKLQEAVAENGLHINTKVADVVTAGIVGVYDVVLISFMLHHLNKSDAVRLISEAQHHTVVSGVHVIATFTDRGDLAARNNDSMRFYPNEETIKEIYSDWDIKELLIKEVQTHARAKSGARMRNHVVMLTAVKR